MIIDMIPLMIGGGAIVHCLFLIAALLRLSGKLANKLLVVTLFLLAIRMGACLVGLSNQKLESAGLYFGAVAFSLIGPCTYWYLHSLLKPTFRLHTRHAYHLIPGLLIFMALPFVTVEVVFGLYQLSMLFMLIYVVIGILKFNKSRITNRLDNLRWKWTMYFNAGIGLLMLLFLAQSFYFDSVVYKSIIVASAFVLYTITLVALRYVKLFMYEPARKNKQQQIGELGERIENLMSQEDIFANPLMSVSLLGKQLKVPAYQVSLAINSYSKKSFPELINTYRIRKAEQMLVDPHKSHFTVEAIAYACGFSALSAFYTAFKRTNRKTPNKYRNNALKSIANHATVKVN
ncbi:helix-turn-helix domain-containing protein [Reichenbachiella sp.]|uniref:helix-turn-helix domain-containing protein n=1 Tax=Reichenbachiella sp. TaxID=2184521 RepID=UPI003BB1EA11